MEQLNSAKFSRPIFSCKDGIRFATPEIVARYRASRLSTDVLADISCGIGGQTVFFGKQCNKVYGIDIDGDKLQCARKNSTVYEVDNITFLEGDALSPRIVEQVVDADIIFSDPARPVTESIRQTDSLRPGIPLVLDAYKHITDRFAFEAPPQMPPQRVDFNCEREYISVDGKLNRLTLYFGPLKKYERSVVVLKDDGVHQFESSDIALPALTEVGEPGIFAFEPDPALVKAGLLEELVLKLNHQVEIVHVDEKRRLLTSDALIKSPFFKNTFQVIGSLPVSNCRRINRFLLETDIGHAVIRFNVAPEKYWDIRNRIENGLRGEKTAHLFRISDAIYLCEHLDIS